MGALPPHVGSNPTLSASFPAATLVDMSDRPGSQPAETMAQRRESSLLRWVWRSYVRNALIPLLVVELLLVAVYLTSHAWSASRNVAALRDVARAELSRIADDESEIIEQQLGQVAVLTELLRRRAVDVISTPSARPGERARRRACAAAQRRHRRHRHSRQYAWPRLASAGHGR